ncbi:hypothetical protein BDF20DRAFT_831041 [Mycotypha africana]|uniref:uncharacterized protein n=1 Tax=Mycotypha africana TaxID=64632 RepID=UPI0023007B76|nr:uncharacterized protein BDF20DRAFT_831041 [Mycotypha africana]KAI8990950.1 hypothetical protein BDF20DRAFT_831041 [Mycotypha africana]
MSLLDGIVIVQPILRKRCEGKSKISLQGCLSHLREINRRAHLQFLRKTLNPLTIKEPASISRPAAVEERVAVQKEKNFARKFRLVISMMVASYMSYVFFFACGSPYDHDPNKKAICRAIDPFKEDLYSIFQTDFYKKKVDPYVSPITRQASGVFNDYAVPAYQKGAQAYNDYGVPLYNSYGKPLVGAGSNAAKSFYSSSIHPIVNPHVEKAMTQAQKAREQVAPYVQPVVQKAFIAGEYARKAWENPPPSVATGRRSVAKIVGQIRRRAQYKNVEPTVKDGYRRSVQFAYLLADFFQKYIAPYFPSKQAKALYDQHAKSYVDQLNQKVHFDRFWMKFIANLPERPEAYAEDATAAEAIRQMFIPSDAPVDEDKESVADKIKNFFEEPKATVAKGAEANDDDTIRENEKSASPEATH